MAEKTKQEAPEGMVPWEQTEEAMDLGDSHPEDDIWVDDDGNAAQGGGESGDSRITDGSEEPAAGTESPTSQPTQQSEGMAMQEGQEQPQEPQGGQEQPQMSQEPQEVEGQPQMSQEPQEVEGQPQEGGEEMLSVDDPAQAQQLLQSVDQMDRAHLTQVAKLIWGDDYEPEDWMSDEYLREDVRGSLMDIVEDQGGAQTEGEDEEE